MADAIRITRTEAIQQGLGRYFTGKPCKYGHFAERFTKWRSCIQCHYERKTAAYEAARAAGLDTNVRGRRYHNRNREKRKAANAEYRANNLEKERARSRKFIRDNRPYYNAQLALRKARKLQATPMWADLNAIERIYRDCPPDMTVDHIVPLVHPMVCGLHVPQNLQYLTALENSSKGNRWWPGQW